MTDCIILQTISREPAGINLLVQRSGNSWKLLTANAQALDLPIETAVQLAESIFGEESVSSLWKLGETIEKGIKHHIYCLDTEAIDRFEPQKILDDMFWIDHETYFRELTAFHPVMAKIKRLLLDINQ